LVLKEKARRKENPKLKMYSRISKALLTRQHLRRSLKLKELLQPKGSLQLKVEFSTQIDK
jgi:hypothetical protein